MKAIAPSTKVTTKSRGRLPMRRLLLSILLFTTSIVHEVTLAMTDAPILRVARPTNDMAMILKFYRDGVGLDVLYEFRDHDGFDGVMLGRAGAPYHLEFTSQRGHVVPGAPSRDNLLVFYLPVGSEYAAALQRMQAQGFAPVPSFNPYWDEGGATFEDGEGYRVVFYNGQWPH